MKSNRRLRLLILLTGLMLAVRADAILEIKITQGVEGALPIAILPFAWEGKSGPAAPEAVADIVTADLTRSGQFRTVGETGKPIAKGAEPNFASWRAAGAESVVLGRVRETGPDRYTVQFQLFDTIQGRQLIGYSIPVKRKDLRRAAHQISDYIYEKLIGRRGAFNTRIAYVTTEVKNNDKHYVLQIADADGHNPRVILDSPKPLMSPAWSPDARRIAYVSFEDNRAGVYVQEIATGEKIKLPARSGINGAPAWSPDGRSLAMALSESGNLEIYVMDVASKRLRRITHSRAIDTEPTWMPDGRSLVFTSDRSGRAQLYRIPVSGGRAERLSYEGDNNSDADVSPEGDKIALVQDNHIAVMDLNTGYVRVLTGGGLDEAPSFAPNASMIIYATVDRGRGVLAAVSEDGRVHQQLVLSEGEVREPAWSPYLD